MWCATSSRQTSRSAQEAADKQPRVMKLGDAAIVRFDGVDDHLRGEASRGAGVVHDLLVAAPRQNPGGVPRPPGVQQGRREGLRERPDDRPRARSPRRGSRTLNVEGRGFGGAQNLRKRDDAVRPAAHARSRVRRRRRRRSGWPSTARRRASGRATARRSASTRSPSAPATTPTAPGRSRCEGFGRCDIAEVLVYDRVLPADETKQVREYLDREVRRAQGRPAARRRRPRASRSCR